MTKMQNSKISNWDSNGLEFVKFEFGAYLFIRFVMPIGRHRLPRALKLLCGGAADGAAHHPLTNLRFDF
jgi:hypothetical protein